VVCHPKDQGSLGIQDLEVKTRALLGKCLFKLLTENEIWQTLLKGKYIGSNALSRVYWKPENYHFWTSIVAMKQVFFPYGSLCFRDGSEIRLWEDKWLGHANLRE
jgi:hypothetical protein